MHEMALLFSSARLRVGRPIILAAMSEMSLSLVQLVTDTMLKKQVEQYNVMGCMILMTGYFFVCHVCVGRSRVYRQVSLRGI